MPRGLVRVSQSDRQALSLTEHRTRGAAGPSGDVRQTGVWSLQPVQVHVSGCAGDHQTCCPAQWMLLWLLGRACCRCGTLLARWCWPTPLLLWWWC